MLISMDYNFDPSYINTYAIPSKYTSQYYIRYAADCETESLRPIIVTNPHRAELELITYGRQHFVQNFQPDTIISLPFKMFIDAFGAYRNMYRSLLGVYGLPAFYPDHIASLRSSVIPLTLGPFGVDENEVLRSLTYLRELDKGCEIELVGGETLFVCAFTICFVSDIPQQAKLAGCLNHKATRGCRDCLILSAQRANLNFNIVKNGRLHHHMRATREEVKGLSQAAKTRKLREIGLSDNDSLLQTSRVFTPILDDIRSRPVDAAHSETTSLVKHCQKILFAITILPKFHQSFLHEFQAFLFPPRWHRIQSPITHIESWRMVEAAQASMVMPVVLRHWLKREHVRPEDSSATLMGLMRLSLLSEVMGDYQVEHAYVWPPPPKITKSEFSAIVEDGRKEFQFFCHIASRKNTATTRPRRGRQVVDTNSMGTAGPDDGASTVAPSLFTVPTIDSIDIEREAKGAKATVYEKLKGLPNVHAGLHLTHVAHSFGACRHVFTLLGEDKHREYKRDITNTNHHNAA
uniref:Uncharacterized protein n=1 Tax=Bionectria ochroleuca TaxID=29856 RepID=A0A8H7N767_BIOOC